MGLVGWVMRGSFTRTVWFRHHPLCLEAPHLSTPTIKLPNTVPDPFVQEVAGRHEPLVFVGLGPVPVCALGPEPFVPSGLPVVVGHQPVPEVLLCLDPAQRDGRCAVAACRPPGGASCRSGR